MPLLKNTKRIFLVHTLVCNRIYLHEFVLDVFLTEESSKRLNCLNFSNTSNSAIRKENHPTVITKPFYYQGLDKFT